MCLNEKKIKLLQTKNILFICFGVFEALFSGSYIVSEFVMYRDNLYTAWHAKSMVSSILFFTVGSILLVHALISRHRIGQATFFSSYFTDMRHALDARQSFAGMPANRVVF